MVPMRMLNEDLCIDEREITRVAKEVINVIKKELPKEYQCFTVVDNVLINAKSFLGTSPINL